MKNAILALCVLCGTLGGLSFSTGASSDAGVQADRVASNVRFVDLNRIIDQSAAFKPEKETMRARWQKWFKELDSLDEEIKALQNQIQNYAGDKQQSAYGQMVSRYSALRTQAKSLGEFYSAQKSREEAELLIKWTERIREVCAGYAKDRGIDAILHNWTEPAEELDLEKRYNSIIRRATLFVDPKLDVSDDVIGLLSQ